VLRNHTLALVENLSVLFKQRTTIWRTVQGAGYGAFASSILSSSVPTVFVTAGPGITNIVTAVAQAYNEKLSMIVIGVNNWLSTLDKRIGTIHELERTNFLFAPISLQTISVSSAEQFCIIIDECYSKRNLLENLFI
jgi:acetolactate synthase-1/2/3 large subunit